ncbi:MAG: LPS export ABC transporter periplasmic protein LptC [Bacteroidetes bacterium]|nr:LPS export ABC transporter periplasmic protein LptC [Bacteroidota bacterium]
MSAGNHTSSSSCLFFLAVLSLILIVSACENDEKEIREFTRKKMGVDEAKKIELFYSQSGKVKSRLTAPVMNRYQDTLPRVEFPNTLHVDFFNDSLQIESILDAKFGRYIEGQNKAFLKDSVVAIQKFNQDTVRCKELWWDQNKQQFYTDKPALITKKDGTVIPAKKGFTASQDFKTIVLKEPTEGILPMPESGFSVTDSALKEDGVPANRDTTHKPVLQ